MQSSAVLGAAVLFVVLNLSDAIETIKPTEPPYITNAPALFTSNGMPTIDVSKYEPYDCYCPKALRPFCASNGITYHNLCVLACANRLWPWVIMNHEGECFSNPSPKGKLQSFPPPPDNTFNHRKIVTLF